MYKFKDSLSIVVGGSVLHVLCFFACGSVRDRVVRNVKDVAMPFAAQGICSFKWKGCSLPMAPHF